MTSSPTPSFRLDGCIAVLTGGLGRLGTSFALALADAGARVAIFDRATDIPAEVQTGVANGTIMVHHAELTDEQAVAAAFDAVHAAWGSPTILVNAAGWRSSPNATQQGGLPFEKYPLEVWDDVFRANLTSAVVCMKAFAVRLLRDGLPGSIINIASIYAHVSPDPHLYAFREERGLPPFVKDASYGASKAALVRLTRDLAVQWGAYGIRVNTISPGGVQHGGSDPAFVERYANRTPMGRMASPEDLLGALIYLASEASSYVTGVDLTVDGGYILW